MSVDEDRLIGRHQKVASGGHLHAAGDRAPNAEIDVMRMFPHNVNLGAGTLPVSPVPKSTAVVTFPVRILRAVLHVPRRVVELDIPGRLALGVRLGGERARLLSGRRIGQGHRRGGDRYRRGTSRQQWCDEASFPCHGDPF
jgi:hypothetical protein